MTGFAHLVATFIWRGISRFTSHRCSYRSNRACTFAMGRSSFLISLDSVPIAAFIFTARSELPAVSNSLNLVIHSLGAERGTMGDLIILYLVLGGFALAGLRAVLQSEAYVQTRIQLDRKRRRSE